MIISGGVNIYPQEIENLLITHPEGGRRRRLRRAQRRPRRGGQGGRPADAGRRADRRADRGAARVLPRPPLTPEVPARSTTSTNSPDCRPASCTRRRSATSTGATALLASDPRRLATVRGMRLRLILLPVDDRHDARRDQCVRQRRRASETTAADRTRQPGVGFCVEQGGTVEIVDEADGQVGYCNLPDGTRVDEWEYFRAESGDTATTEP